MSETVLMQPPLTRSDIEDAVSSLFNRAGKEASGVLVTTWKRPAESLPPGTILLTPEEVADALCRHLGVDKYLTKPS